MKRDISKALAFNIENKIASAMAVNITMSHIRMITDFPSTTNKYSVAQAIYRHLQANIHLFDFICLTLHS